MTDFEMLISTEKMDDENSFRLTIIKWRAESEHQARREILEDRLEGGLWVETLDLVSSQPVSE